MRSHLSPLLAVVVFFAAPSAFAQWLPGHDYVLDRSGNVIHVRGPSITTPSYVVSGNSAGAVVVSKKAFDVAGHRVAIEAAKNIPWKNVATGVARAARITPYSMAAGFAVEWLVDNGWRYVECVNNASTCDGAIQWQRKQDKEGEPGYEYCPTSLGCPPYYPSATDAANAIKKSSDDYIASQSQYWRDRGGYAQYTGVYRFCPAYSCVYMQFNVAGSSTMGEHQFQLGKRATANSVPELWSNSPPPDFENDPPAPPDPGKAPDIWDDALPGGIPDTADPPVLSGPPSVSGPSSSSQSTPGGSSTSTTTYNFTYNNGTVTITQTTTTSNSDGSTTTTQSDVPADKPLCGVPGYPSCEVSVDEAGTPEWEQPDNSRLDEIKAADAAKMNEVAQTIPDPDLGWFGAPPIAACRKIVFPHGIGEADPCGVVDSVRSVMAYLWAIVAAWMSFGWIRQAVNGG